MTGQRRHRPKSAALTLVELLVVITILLIVAGVVLPLAQPALKKSAPFEKRREKSRRFWKAPRQRPWPTRQPVGCGSSCRN